MHAQLLRVDHRGHADIGALLFVLIWAQVFPFSLLAQHLRGLLGMLVHSILSATDVWKLVACIYINWPCGRPNSAYNILG
jgi:hypothetical protein